MSLRVTDNLRLTAIGEENYDIKKVLIPHYMNYEKEIQELHDKGFVILQASRATNAPVGWKRKITPNNKKLWGYSEEMGDPLLSVYHSTFNATLLARSHCGFYMGHSNLCCIDLDTKKTTPEVTERVKDSVIKALNKNVVIESTKSNGYHVYFLYDKRLPNDPDFTGLKIDNWIELYYQKRFVASYLSNSKKYTLLHGNLLTLKPLTTKLHTKLLAVLEPFKGEKLKPKKSNNKKYPVDEDTLKRAEMYVRQLEEKGLDITGGNPTWFKIGKSFASAFGIKGFDIFNRLSQYSPTYNADTIEEVYNGFVQGDINHNGNTKITIATFFKMCEDAGLADLETLQALKLHPVTIDKEFELTLTKKERMPEHVHILVDAFIKEIKICCIDGATFFIFRSTHWIKHNTRQVVDLINDFVDRSNVEDKFRKLLRTVPYLEMALKELRLITQRDSIEPHTGNLNGGIFINMENGILHVDMKTGKRKLLDHESSYNFTTLLPFCYEPAAECICFDEWMISQIPDATLHIAYYAFVASCLTHHKADIIMLLAGETSTGKSSLIDITRRLIGLENSAAVSAGILFGGTAEAQIQALQMENKLLAYDFDASPFKSLEMLLKVAAQEPLPGWQMHVTRRPVINYGRLIIAMNPANYSVFNPAVARRFITINMDVAFVKDNSIMPAIYENELAGIFNHVLNVGVKHLLENGGQIKVTDSMKLATLKFHTGNRDAIRWFELMYMVLKVSKDKNNKTSVEEKLKIVNPNTDIVFTTVSEMYQAFRIWMMDVEGVSEHKLLMRKYFAADIKLLGIEDQVFKINGVSKKGFFVGELKK